MINALELHESIRRKNDWLSFSENFLKIVEKISQNKSFHEESLN